jgi:uncharacterized protein YciI
MTQPRTWFVLQHRRGPAVAEGQAVFDHPGIAAHYEFLRDRMADGTLVAAGPLADVEGAGMTVLQVTDQAEAERLARSVDASVVNGVLEVTVRPWTVVMAPVAER